MGKMSLLIAAAMVAGTSGAALANSHAASAVDYEYVYYDRDPGDSTARIVGRERYFCDSSTDFWGTISEHGTYNSYGC